MEKKLNKSQLPKVSDQQQAPKVQNSTYPKYVEVAGYFHSKVNNPG